MLKATFAEVILLSYPGTGVGQAQTSGLFGFAAGSPYGGGVTPAAASNADIGERVFLGLRGLGYKETEAKRALARAFAEHEPENPGGAEPMTAATLLKRTLVLLGRRGRGRDLGVTESVSCLARQGRAAGLPRAQPWDLSRWRHDESEGAPALGAVSHG